MNRTIAILLVAAAAACQPAQSSEKAAAAASADATQADQSLEPGRALWSSHAGTWQVVSLPRSWIRQRWNDAPPRSAYLILRGPHPEDLVGDYAPCLPPPRLLVGVVRENREVEEHTLACLHYCAPTDGVDGVYRDLWAARTHLRGITVQLTDDGLIEVIEHFRKRADTPEEVERDVRIVDKIRYEGEPRLRTHRFTADDLIAALGTGDVPCLDLPYDPPY